MTQVIAPGYQGDNVDDSAILIASVAGSNLPQAVVSYARQAETQEGEAVAGVLIIDGSASMEAVQDAVIEGLNMFRNVITTSHERRKMHVRVIIFNSRVHPWEPFGPDSPFLTALQGDPNFIPEFTTSVYSPRGSTALYRAVLEGIAAVEILGQEFKMAGYDVRHIVQVVSDGLDNMSTSNDLAQLQQAVIRRKMLEGVWTFNFFGFIDSVYTAEVSNYLGKSAANAADHEALAERIFKAIACGGDVEMDKALNCLQPGAILGGMKFPENMVAVFPRDPDQVRDGIGVKLSTTFVKASAGKISTSVAITAQFDPAAPVSGTGTTAGSFI